MEPLTEREAATYRLERIRAVAAGILETAQVTFLLLIAHRWFHAGPAEKGMLQGASSAGLLLTPVLVTMAATLRWNAERAAGRLFTLGAAGLLATVLFPTLPVLVAGAGLGVLCTAATAPFLASIYSRNYHAGRRGDLFSRTIVVRIVASVLFAWLAGLWLEARPDGFRWILGFYAAALALNAWCVSRCPPVPLEQEDGRNPLRAFRYVRTDRVFRWTLISWMLMGFGNLIMFPLRVEYLSNHRYGLHLSPSEIALLTSVAPNAARLLFTRMWGRLFDRMNFFTLRIILNTGFMLGILSFFTGGGQAGLWAGAVLFGVSNAGADLAWSLWVTKVAPPNRVTDYMAVHTFLTGFRGVIAAFAAFQCAVRFGIGPTAAGAAGLILLASLLLIREKRRAPETPVAQDGSKASASSSS
ncbi:MAG: MFS transporter [Verrucomicrobiaceae bacterium]|nr:MAG: MFS transporter [Verrucomicrobiaceae bacterium]